MAKCTTCGKEKGFFEGGNGLCSECFAKNLTSEKDRIQAEKIEQQQAQDAERARIEEHAKQIVITTEAFIGDVERIDIVSAEVVFGMNLFKDVLANIRDVFGGRSGVVQNTLADARDLAFKDLKVKAAALGADAVIAIDIDYHSISTGSGINMLMVSANGTAVKFKQS